MLAFVSLVNPNPTLRWVSSAVWLRLSATTPPRYFHFTPSSTARGDDKLLWLSIPERSWPLTDTISLPGDYSIVIDKLPAISPLLRSQCIEFLLSHISAGCSECGTVQLPNLLNPVFILLNNFLEERWNQVAPGQAEYSSKQIYPSVFIAPVYLQGPCGMACTLYLPALRPVAFGNPSTRNYTILQRGSSPPCKVCLHSYLHTSNCNA